jgi:hypothetical protein
MERFCAFDIEITTEIPEGTDDWKALRPLGISCAATLTDAGDLRLWHGAEQPDGRLAERMTPMECQALVEYLVSLAKDMTRVLTWNGLGFDLDILQEECGRGYMQDFCHLLARHDHIDMMFQIFCQKGFGLGLDVAAKGMGLAGKTEGIHRDLAPVMWAQGRVEQDKVLEYVAQNVRTTADLYRAILKERCLRWQARSGGQASWSPTLHTSGDVRNLRMLTVDECLRLPEPDTSWMRNPWPRSKFAGWLREPRERPSPKPVPVPAQLGLPRISGGLEERKCDDPTHEMLDGEVWCPRCDGHGDYLLGLTGGIICCEVCEGRGSVHPAFQQAYIARKGSLSICDKCYSWTWCVQAGEQRLCSQCSLTER